MTAKRSSWAASDFVLLGEVVAFWREREPSVAVVNEYGPTEAAVGCCVYSVPAGIPGNGALCIGQPTPGTRLYVLDGDKNLVPVGMPGELHRRRRGFAAGSSTGPT